ncbi:MAG: RluA family pseudouridine synthase [bacterium]
MTGGESVYAGPPERLDRAVAAVAEVSRTAARGLIAAGAVFLNRQRCKVASRTVRPGDRLRVGSAIGEPPAAPLLSILYEAADVVAIDKPAGMPSAPTQQAATGTALAALTAQMTAPGGSAPRLWVVHRLDAATSGVLVFATTQAAAAELSEAFRLQRVRKRYLALVAAAPSTAEGRIELALGAQRGRAVVEASGRAALTLWRVRERRATATLLEVEPQSGRMHQIRVHLAAIGHPILGDRLYDGPPAPRLMLHAAAVTLARADGDVCIEAPAPF